MRAWVAWRYFVLETSRSDEVLVQPAISSAPQRQVDFHFFISFPHQEIYHVPSENGSEAYCSLPVIMHRVSAQETMGALSAWVALTAKSFGGLINDDDSSHGCAYSKYARYSY